MIIATGALSPAALVSKKNRITLVLPLLALCGLLSLAPAAASAEQETPAQTEQKQQHPSRN